MTERDLQCYWVFSQTLHSAVPVQVMVTAADALADLARAVPRLKPVVMRDLQIEEKRHG